MGVPTFSCLIKAETQELGVSTISDGKEAVLGVWRGGRTGLVTAGMLKSTTRESVLKGLAVE
jgi:hypothetical protein